MPLTERIDALNTKDLQKMLRLAGIKPATNKKASMVVALNNYLSNQQNIIEIWHSLGNFEKDLMVEYLQSDGGLERNDIEEIYKKHNRVFNIRFASYYNSSFNRYIDDLARAKLFFLGSKIPSLIKKTLETFIPAPEIVFTPVEELQENDYDTAVIIGESFVNDFTNVIKLVNSARLKSTPKSQMPTKASFIKINGVLENKEIMLFDGEDIRNIRIIDNTTRIYGIANLLLESNIIMLQDDLYVVGDYANEFLSADLVEKCSMLLDNYIESCNIDELDRIREIKLKTEESRIFIDCRKLILKYLSKCPINEWIATLDFQQVIKRYDRKFLASITGEISVYNDYERFYAGRYNDWLEIEGRFIEIVLLEYLAAMGIVDVTVDSVDSDFVWYLSVSYFRLTPLGAYVLGVNDDYTYHTTTSEYSGFTVQPNYEIVISDGSMSHVHALFFDPFAEKVSDDVVTIYKLSFKAMVNALDNGIKICEIIDYLKEHSTHDIPENVLLSLQDWERVSKKIRIRKVTLLETDDEYLLQELKSYKTIKKYITRELTYAFEIDGKAATKLKREIEKKNHFCQIE